MKLFDRSAFQTVLASAAILSIVVGAVLAAVCSTKPIMGVVPFAVGGSPDVVARMLGASMMKLQQQPVVEKKADARSTQ